MFTLGVFVLVTLGLARVTRLLTADRIFAGFRRWIVNRYGEDSMTAYWAHCPWCWGLWLSFLAAPLWAFTTLPLHWWWLAAPGAFAMSHLVGLMHRLEGD
jgi:hypothetical protein